MSLIDKGTRTANQIAVAGVLFNSNHDDNISRLSIGELAGVAQLNLAAVLNVGGNFHPQLFTSTDKVFFQSLSGLLSGNDYLILDFGAGWRLWPTEYFLQVNAARRFKAYFARAS